MRDRRPAPRRRRRRGAPAPAAAPRSPPGVGRCPPARRRHRGGRGVADPGRRNAGRPAGTGVGRRGSCRQPPVPRSRGPSVPHLFRMRPAAGRGRRAARVRGPGRRPPRRGVAVGAPPVAAHRRPDPARGHVGGARLHRRVGRAGTGGGHLRPGHDAGLGRRPGHGGGHPRGDGLAGGDRRPQAAVRLGAHDRIGGPPRLVGADLDPPLLNPLGLARVPRPVDRLVSRGRLRDTSRRKDFASTPTTGQGTPESTSPSAVEASTAVSVPGPPMKASAPGPPVRTSSPRRPSSTSGAAVAVNALTPVSPRATCTAVVAVASPSSTATVTIAEPVARSLGRSASVRSVPPARTSAWPSGITVAFEDVAVTVRSVAGVSASATVRLTSAPVSPAQAPPVTATVGGVLTRYRSSVTSRSPVVVQVWPPTTILLSGWTARSWTNSASVPGRWFVVATPPFPKVGSGLPSGRYTATTNSVSMSYPPSCQLSPAATMRPSGRTATVDPRASLLATARPASAKLVSIVPSSSTRMTAKSVPVSPGDSPMATILPSAWMASSSGEISESVSNTPASPKPVSSVPSERRRAMTTRARASPQRGPSDPAARTFPSGWITTSVGVNESLDGSAPIGTRTRPSGPQAVSGAPSGRRRSSVSVGAPVASEPCVTTRILPSGCTAMSLPQNAHPAAYVEATPPSPNPLSRRPSASSRSTGPLYASKDDVFVARRMSPSGSTSTADACSTRSPRSTDAVPPPPNVTSRSPASAAAVGTDTTADVATTSTPEA